MSKRRSNKSVKRMMDDVAFGVWKLRREEVNNDLINSWKMYKKGCCTFDNVETRFVSLTASELKVKK